MPDFEALIRHQQDQQPTTNKRLKVVDKTHFDSTKSEDLTTKSGLLFNFIGGFIGSVIGTLTILFLYINEYLPIDLLKFK